MGTIEYIDASEETGVQYNVARGMMFMVSDGKAQLPHILTSVVFNEDLWCLTDLTNGMTSVLKGSDMVQDLLRHMGAVEACSSFNSFAGMLGKAALALDGAGKGRKD